MLKGFLPLSFVCLLLIIPSYGAGPAAEASSNNNRAIVTRHELHHDISQPLRDLAAGSAPALQRIEREADEIKVIPLPSGFKPANEPDPVLQSAVIKRSADQAAIFRPVA